MYSWLSPQDQFHHGQLCRGLNRSHKSLSLVNPESVVIGNPEHRPHQPEVTYNLMFPIRDS